MTKKRAYCIACGQEQPYSTSSSMETLTRKGIQFTTPIIHAHCTVCGDEIYVPEINDENASRREAEFQRAYDSETSALLNGDNGYLNNDQQSVEAKKDTGKPRPSYIPGVSDGNTKNVVTQRMVSMNSEQFEKIIGEQIETCKGILLKKAGEYATGGDRLHNFKAASGMMGCDPKEALAGMMAKHTISVYDMCRSGQSYPIELWSEKITDHINYLLLLKAAVVEELMSHEDPPEGEPYKEKQDGTEQET